MQYFKDVASNIYIIWKPILFVILSYYNYFKYSFEFQKFQVSKLRFRISIDIYEHIFVLDGWLQDKVISENKS